ncbi:MAG TPA: serine O-acetyltransferase [Candidatus Acidoferrum sp.]|jgi:serine O-acetyltransferase
MVTSKNELQCLASEFRAALEARLSGDRAGEYRLPSKDEVAAVCRRYLEGLFPLFHAPAESQGALVARFLEELDLMLAEQLVCAIRFDCSCRGKEIPRDVARAAENLLIEVRGKLPYLANLMATDLEAALTNDPAASGLEEILLSYPGIEAITVQRLAHELYLLKIPYLPRMMTEVAHSRTGIDIHPGATIDESFFIDHGTGVVIGETATIGKHVTLYHGVTLGAFNPVSRRDAGGELVRGITNKRHPDIEDHVTIYSGASIIGGDTRVGHHSIIGGNVWLTRSVAPYSRVTVKEPELVIRSHNKGTDEEWFLGSSI